MRAVKSLLILLLFLRGTEAFTQSNSTLDSFRLFTDVKITVDKPENLRAHKEAVIIFYALPNGNSTAWTMGKKISPGDDWHFDIQHILAQTVFIRQTDRKKDYIVVYLENDQKSWPAWKQKHPDYASLIPVLIDSVINRYGRKKISVHLNGHSGGGSFIFGYLANHIGIRWEITRISFMDSNYGYDGTYFPFLVKWLQRKKAPQLNVFAYNDSVALLNGKPFVSATGGTWHRSGMMIRDLQSQWLLERTESDSLVHYRNRAGNIRFYLKKNLDRGIYHTQQVELNGFIHSVFAGTRFEERGYRYYGERAYERFIR